MDKELKNVILNEEMVVAGFCDTINREELLEEAIKGLQENAQDWAKEEYYGIKNYAGFGDQREDHEYGMGPRHGSIVFKIGRGEKYNPAKKDLYIKLLVHLRDFRNESIKHDKHDYLLALNKVVKLENELFIKLQKIQTLFGIQEMRTKGGENG